MKIFISYARVDKPFCIHLVHKLNVHDVWYDQRLYAGTHWWKEILRRLEWCDVFIYLLSAHSVTSEYCLKELDYARKLGREILPVLIDPNTELPEDMREIHYVDLSQGIGENIADLLNGIYVADVALQHRRTKRQKPTTEVKPTQLPPYSHSPETVGDAVNAMKNGEYDRASMLLRQAMDRGYVSSFIDLRKLLAEAENLIETETIKRERDMHYKEIKLLFQYEGWKRDACEALKRFNDVYPDYDPDGLIHQCFKLSTKEKSAPKTTVSESTQPSSNRTDSNNGSGGHDDDGRGGGSRGGRGDGGVNIKGRIPLLEWCTIPSGMVKMDDYVGRGQAVYVDSFLMSRYPVTNAQFDLFIKDRRGYSADRWWTFSKEAEAWHKEHPKGLPSKFQGAERPRENVSWYEAMAFCHWLSHYAKVPITLPSLSQWLRGAIGDCDYLFPWGNTFEAIRCNTRDNHLNQTTVVTRYPEGMSMFGVWDMAGNIWEWCTDKVEPDQPNHDFKRSVIGGSHVSPPDRAQTSVRYFLNPETRFATIGFRIIALAEDANQLLV